MARPLTIKQAKFVKAKAEGKTGTEAAMIAYDVKNERTASVISAENLAKPSIQEAVQESLARQGLTVDLVVKPIVHGLVADKPSFTDKDGNEHGGGADHSIRLKASGMALDLMGAKKGGDSPTINNFGVIVNELKDKYAD